MVLDPVPRTDDTSDDTDVIDRTKDRISFTGHYE